MLSMHAFECGWSVIYGVKQETFTVLFGLVVTWMAESIFLLAHMQINLFNLTVNDGNIFVYLNMKFLPKNITYFFKTILLIVL